MVSTLGKGASIKDRKSPSYIKESTGMKLTREQIDFFETFGFLKLPGLFINEMEDLINEFERVFCDF